MIADLSVFLPCYNEATSLEKTIQRAVAVLKTRFVEWELIIVDDGSTDETLSLTNRLAQTEPRLRLVRHPVNRGYGAALRSGMNQARYGWIAFTDGDGQFDLSEIDLFIKKQAESQGDVVVGYYLKRAVPLYRKINTFLWELVVNFLFSLKVKDVDCGFKLFSQKVVAAVWPLLSERGAFISTEFLVRAKRAGLKIVEVGVNHYPRRQGKGTGANLDVIVRSFADLFRLWRNLR